VQSRHGVREGGVGCDDLPSIRAKRRNEVADEQRRNVGFVEEQDVGRRAPSAARKPV
jgi:hypothetical protein